MTRGQRVRERNKEGKKETSCEKRGKERKRGEKKE